MTARDRLNVRMRRALRHMKPAHVVKTRLTKRVVSRFADKVGLVYFGYVDQKDDDHRLIRGHTVSQTHVDNNYCLGSVRGYDVLLVSRNDVVKTRAGVQQRCHWLIYTIDLHTKSSLPHVYVGHRSRDAAFMASFTRLYPLAIGNTGQYAHRFLSDYTVYGTAAHTLEIERMITPQIADVIASHFQGASFEIENGTVYLYVESEHPTEQLLERMLSNGLWLAESIDTLQAERTR